MVPLTDRNMIKERSTKKITPTYDKDFFDPFFILFNLYSHMYQFTHKKTNHQLYDISRTEKKNRINHLLWHTARNGEIGEFDLDLFQPFLAVEAVDVVNAGDVDGKIPGISGRLDGPIPGTIADDPHITSWRKDDGNYMFDRSREKRVAKISSYFFSLS